MCARIEIEIDFLKLCEYNERVNIFINKKEKRKTKGSKSGKFLTA